MAGRGEDPKLQGRIWGVNQPGRAAGPNASAILTPGGACLATAGRSTGRTPSGVPPLTVLLGSEHLKVRVSLRQADPDRSSGGI